MFILKKDTVHIIIHNISVNKYMHLSPIYIRAHRSSFCFTIYALFMHVCVYVTVYVIWLEYIILTSWSQRMQDVYAQNAGIESQQLDQTIYLHACMCMQICFDRHRSLATLQAPNCEISSIRQKGSWLLLSLIKLQLKPLPWWLSYKSVASPSLIPLPTPWWELFHSKTCGYIHAHIYIYINMHARSLKCVYMHTSITIELIWC